jgi:hypothetical protein
MKSELHSGFDRLSNNCSINRGTLLRKAHAMMILRRRLNFAAGILAFVSSCSLVSLAVGDWGEVERRMLAAGFSFLSGLVSLGLGLMGGDHEIADMLKGAAEYLRLSEETNASVLNDGMPESKLREILRKKGGEYAHLDSRYNRYWLGNLAPTRKLEIRAMSYDELESREGKGESDPPD